jgi:hypothetical protein
MGLVSLLITLGIMVVGIGYYFFGMSGSSVTMTNENEIPGPSPVTYEALKEQTTDLKEEIEQKAEETMKQGQGIAVGEPDPNQKTPPAQEEKKEETTLAIKDRLMSSGFAVPSKARSIDTIVLHSSYDAEGNNPYDVSGLVREYESYGVSAHYLIDRAGTIYRLVKDANIAYHAGVSKMPDGRTGVNDFSIGIEMMNQKETSYTDAQYTAVNKLVAYLKGKYSIKYVVGHDDIAPDRKTDPWNFDWKRLAK